MICANRLAPAVLFSIGCAGLPAATHLCCDPCAAATSEISPSHSPTGSGRMTHYPEVGGPGSRGNRSITESQLARAARLTTEPGRHLRPPRRASILRRCTALTDVPTPSRRRPARRLESAEHLVATATARRYPSISVAIRRAKFRGRDFGIVRPTQTKPIIGRCPFPSHNGSIEHGRWPSFRSRYFATTAKRLLEECHHRA